MAIKVGVIIEITLIIMFMEVKKEGEPNLSLKEFKKTNFNNKDLNMDN